MQMSCPWIFAGLVAGAAACGGTARGLEAYRADTGNLLATRNAELQQCYGEALKTSPGAAGTVTVQFVVARQSGVISQATVDPARSTAPAALGACVVHAVDGLVLTPPDRNEGRATFVYEFKPSAAPAS